MSMTTEQLLAERQKTHGEYTDHARCTQNILRAMQAEKNWNGLSDIQKESLHMFAHKMGRIATGNPNIHDHWDDIAGYAKLVSDRIPKQNPFADLFVNARSGDDTEKKAMESYVRGEIQAKAEYPAGHGYDPQMDV